METALRHIALLRMIPKKPKKICLDGLRKGLKSLGYEVSDRTIQRDLQKLSRFFPLLSDERSKPYGWYFDESFDGSLSAVSPHEALTDVLASKFLQNYLPPPIKSQVDRNESRAFNVLSESTCKSLIGWPDKVSHIPNEIQLLAPEVKQAVVDKLYDALFAELKIEINYKNKEKQTVSPLGIVVRGQVIYLVCTFWSYKDLRHIAVHRIQSLNILDEQVQYPERFNLERYIAEGGFKYPQNSGRVSVELEFMDKAGNHLIETPLSEDQVITEIEKNHLHVTATVEDTKELRWWLLGFGQYVKVISPSSLRDEMRQKAKQMYANYCK
ncbi:helix-turn-helix transcriptional regulator [Neptuniibacter sp. QD48_55]|uniref:helix-turn-helix transcriptional regulator n=1 Tax=Neptuniibacter sp. QD48_55 TaxID=3398212 RepID=UPI0039F4BCD5